MRVNGFRDVGIEGGEEGIKMERVGNGEVMGIGTNDVKSRRGEGGGDEGVEDGWSSGGEGSDELDTDWDGDLERKKMGD